MNARKLISWVLAMVMLLTTLSAAGLTVTAEEADPNLLLHFDFNDFTGGQITDTTGNITVNSSNGTTDGMKEGDTAMYLSGEDASFTWMAKDYDPLAQAQDGITITMWLQNQDISGWRHLFNYGNSANRFTGNYVFLQQQAGGGVRINTSYNANVDGNYDDMQKGQNLSGGLTAAGVNQWKMLTFTEDGAGNWNVYEDNALAATWNGSEAGASSIAKINAQVNAADVALGTDGARYSLFAPQANLWDNDAGMTGAVQSFSIYKGVKTAEEIATMYNSVMDADSEAVAAVIALIDTAMVAEAGSAQQLSAYKTAKAAYEALNTLEKDQVTNAAALERIVADYVAASGVILGFDFNGDLEEILGRTTINSYNGFASVGDSALQVNGGQTSFWTKTGAIYRRDYPVLSQAPDAITIELVAQANSWSTVTTMFAYTHGTDRLLKFLGEQDGTLRLEMKAQDGITEGLITATSEPGVLPTGEWTTVSLVQYKSDEYVHTTEAYVNGNLVLTSTGFPSFALLDRTDSSDDVYFIGSSDYTDYTFNGAIDSFYVYNYAKGFEADYTKVDAAIAATEELTPDDYTAASWQALQDAIAAVDRTLSFAKQDVVDGYADAINRAVANLIPAGLEMNISITDGAVSESEKSASYKNITWNATIDLGEETDLDTLNAAVTFKEYGVIYGMNDAAVQMAADGEATTLAKKIAFGTAEGEDGIDVYTLFGFRLKNAAIGASRSAMFYVTYEANGRTYTIYSDIAQIAAE